MVLHYADGLFCAGWLHARAGAAPREDENYHTQEVETHKAMLVVGLVIALFVFAFYTSFAHLNLLCDQLTFTLFL
jgi:hypothetical protein